jgi:hypothetical protein
MAYRLVFRRESSSSGGLRVQGPEFSDLVPGDCPYRVGSQLGYERETFLVTGLRLGAGNIMQVDCESASGRPIDPRKF